MNIFAISWDFDIDFDNDFFNKFKEIFINIVIKNYWRKWKILNKLFLWVDIIDDDILEYIKSIDFDNIKLLLWEDGDYN